MISHEAPHGSEPRPRQGKPCFMVVTGSGSCKDALDPPIGAWAAVFRSFHDQKPTTLEFARGRVEEGTTSAKMKIMAMQEGARRLPQPLHEKAEVRFDTDHLSTVRALEKAIEHREGDWKSKIQDMESGKECIALAGDILALIEQGVHIEVRHVPEPYNIQTIADEAAGQLLEEDQARLAKREEMHFSRNTKKPIPERESS